MAKNVKLTSLIFLSSILLTGCDPTFAKPKPHRFVNGFLIFDITNEGKLPELLDIEGFGDIFTKEEKGFRINGDSSLPLINKQLYIADVNCDGKNDLCYKSVEEKDGQKYHHLVVYDSENNYILYEQNTLETEEGALSSEGIYYFTLEDAITDESGNAIRDIAIVHSMQNLTLYTSLGEEEEETEIVNKCIDKKIKFVKKTINENEENDVTQIATEDIEIPFGILNATLYNGTYDADERTFVPKTGLTGGLQAKYKKPTYFCLLIDYEGTYKVDYLEQNDTRFLGAGEKENKLYNVSFVTDLADKVPHIWRVFKFEFLEISDNITVRIKVKKKEFTFYVQVSS